MPAGNSVYTHFFSLRALVDVVVMSIIEHQALLPVLNYIASPLSYCPASGC